MESLKISDIKNFKSLLVHPDDYDFHSYLANENRKKFLKESKLRAYYITFSVRNKYAYKYIFLSEILVNDGGIDIEKYLKQKCLDWVIRD